MIVSLQSNSSCPFLGGFAGSFIPVNTAFWVFAGAVVGYMSPDFWLTKKTSKRRHKIRRSIPDALDLLTICVDAGLGLDQALLRVGAELDISHPEITEELTQVNLEQRAGKGRIEAWQGLAERSNIEEFKAFVSMLVQTDKFGTPILKALNQFSEEIRQKRKQHAEEAASKTKIKIIFPLVLCIFPCIFIVLLAPAILSIAQAASKRWVISLFFVASSCLLFCVCHHEWKLRLRPLHLGRNALTLQQLRGESPATRFCKTLLERRTKSWIPLPSFVF